MTSALLHHFRLWKHLNIHSFGQCSCQSSFSVVRHLTCKQIFAQIQSCLICIKDDLAMKTLTKMTIYRDKCICSGNIWCVAVICVNTLENIICQSDFDKGSLANFT